MPAKAMTFPTDVPDTSGPSYEMASLADPVTDPSVTATLVLPPRPTPPLHCTVVSDIHALISHPVIPTRPPALAPNATESTARRNHLGRPDELAICGGPRRRRRHLYMGRLSQRLPLWKQGRL